VKKLLPVAILLVAMFLPTTANAGSTHDWLSYHGGPMGTGLDTSLTSVDTSAPKWTSPVLDGTLYAEPLVLGNVVFEATENNSVYALNAQTGAIVWRTHLAPPVPASSLPCGNIYPTVGITGTPVIDAQAHELFVVADEYVNGAPHHVLVGVNTTTGDVMMSRAVDLAGMNPAVYLQRTGLALDKGRVLFGMAGNDGDCANYHGRLYSVSESGNSLAVFTVDNQPGQYRGGIWTGGAAPIIDARGRVWETTGNGTVTTPGQPYDYSDGLLQLTPAMNLQQYFAPVDWASQNAHDQDMSSSPTLLSNGFVLVAGKSPNLYLVRAARLGGIGGDVTAVTSTCPSNTDGGSAVSGLTVILPCLAGPTAVRVSDHPATITPLWQSSLHGGPPIIAAGEVWTMSKTGVLFGLSLATGAVVQSLTLSAPANHFDTPSVGAGELLVATANQVVALRGRS
jgi:outer membrane protein assembly factor BamB